MSKGTQQTIQGLNLRYLCLFVRYSFFTLIFSPLRIANVQKIFCFILLRFLVIFHTSPSLFHSICRLLFNLICVDPGFLTQLLKEPWQWHGFSLDRVLKIEKNLIDITNPGNRKWPDRLASWILAVLQLKNVLKMMFLLLSSLQ